LPGHMAPTTECLNLLQHSSMSRGIFRSRRNRRTIGGGRVAHPPLRQHLVVRGSGASRHRRYAIALPLTSWIAASTIRAQRTIQPEDDPITEAKCIVQSVERNNRTGPFSVLNAARHKHLRRRNLQPVRPHREPRRRLQERLHPLTAFSPVPSADFRDLRL
jgi:hypothetical protein